MAIFGINSMEFFKIHIFEEKYKFLIFGTKMPYTGFLGNNLKKLLAYLKSPLWNLCFKL